MFLGSVQRFGWLEHPRQNLTRLSMSAASGPLKPFPGLPVANLDAVAIAIAETNVELSPDHTCFAARRYQRNAWRLSLPTPSPSCRQYPRSFWASGLPAAAETRSHFTAMRCDRGTPRPSTVPRARLYLCDIMVSQRRLVIQEHCALYISTNPASEVITRAQIEPGAHMPLFGRGLPHAECPLQVPTALVVAEGKPISRPELSVRVSTRRQFQ